jgi:hypothetical protein
MNQQELKKLIDAMKFIEKKTGSDKPYLSPESVILIMCKLVGVKHFPKGDLPVYEFVCPIHGKVRNYPSGFYETLFCPECLKVKRLSDHSIVAHCRKI